MIGVVYTSTSGNLVITVGVPRVGGSVSAVVNNDTNSGMGNMYDGKPVRPLDNMYYLDGYLDFVFNNDDAPDGAWFSMCVSTIEEHWPDCDAHETFMQYMEWKSKQPGSNVVMTLSEAEQRKGGDKK